MSNCVQSCNAVFVLIFLKTIYYKTILLDKFFVISGLVKVSQGKCYQPWPLVQLPMILGNKNESTKTRSGLHKLLLKVLETVEEYMLI